MWGRAVHRGELSAGQHQPQGHPQWEQQGQTDVLRYGGQGVHMLAGDVRLQLPRD